MTRQCDFESGLLSFALFTTNGTPIFFQRACQRGFSAGSSELRFLHRNEWVLSTKSNEFWLTHHTWTHTAHSTIPNNDDDPTRRRQARCGWCPTAASSPINSRRRCIQCRCHCCLGILLLFAPKPKLGTTCAAGYFSVSIRPYIFDFPHRPPTANTASFWPRR